MKTTKYIVTIALALVCAWGNSFAVDQSYYSSVDGKSGKALFDAVHTVSKSGYKSLSYSGLWTAYCAIDINLSGKVWDMYSNVTSFTCGSNQCGSYGKEGDCYNREHSIPKSWFGGSESANTPGTDLFHVVPTDGYVNNIRSADAFGEVASASYTSKSGCKKGSPKSITIENSILNKTGSSSQSCTASTVFEPMDEFKGDFARGYFGTMIKWANGDYQTFTTAEGAQIFNTSYDAAHYYGLKPYGVALLLKWHREDPVSQKEIDRNNGIQTKQGNRNPFIDYPELVEYIWGEHNGESVTLSSLTPTFEGYTPPEATTYTVILSRNGQLESITGATGTYNLPTSSDAACDGWTFAGWSATKVTSTTSTPSYITSVTSGGTVYAVYSKTTPSGAPIRKTPATVGTTLWAETWTGATTATSGSDDATPSANYGHGTTVYNSGTVTYTQSANTVYVRNDNYAGGSSPELMLSSGKTWTISNIPTGEATELTLTYSSNNTKSSVTCSTTGASITGSSKSYTITTGGASTITLEFGCSGNTRIDNVSLTVKTAGSGGGGGGSTTYDSEPAECQCSGNLGTPDVTATPSDQTITLTWPDVANATNGYTVTVSKGVGYTTECGETEIGEITHSGTTNTCIITGLVNDLTYTTSVVANATATICESLDDEDAATPVGCESWDVTFGYSNYNLTAGGAKSAAPTITGTTYGSVTYHSSDEAIITVEEDGKVTPVSAGTATITAHWTGDATHCPKDVTSGEFTVTGLVRITFNANDGSETPATTTQDVTYNVATALTANSFSRTGYTFQGWSTDKNATSATYTDGSNITITAATTLYAVWQVNKHNVTFDQPTNGGTFAVNSSSSSPVNNVNFGSTVTIAITPTNSHFTVGTVSVSGASGAVAVSGEGNSRTFTMPDEDVTVSVTMTEETKYIVNWYVAGTPTAEQNYAGEALAGIADPEIECNGKTFQGWTATANYSSDDTAPNDLFNDASTKTMPSNNTTNYYAVFATETTSGSGSGNLIAFDGTSGKSGLIGIDGVTHNGLGSDYTSHSPYLLRFDDSGDYIQFELSSIPTSLSFGYKMIGGNSSSTMTIKECASADGTYTDVEAFTISGAQNSTGTKTTSNSFSQKYIRMVFTKGSNVGVGAITIAGAGTSYSNYATSCTPCDNKVTLTKGDETNGTFTLNKANGEYNNCTSNFVVTVSNITPADHYHCTGVTATGGNSEVSGPDGSGNYTVTYTKGNNITSTITANFAPNPTYTIRFFNNGVQVGETQNLYEGQVATKPSPDPTVCEGYTFVGWWTAALATDNTTAETWVTDFTVSGAQDYYAVYSHSDGGGSSTVTFTPGTDVGETSVTKGGVTCTMTTMDNASYYQIYASSTGTFSVASGNITSIAITCTTSGTAKYGPGNISASPSGYTYSGTSGTWSGSASSVSFTSSQQVRMTSIVVTVGGGGTTYYTTAPECVECTNKVTLTKGEETNGTFTLNKANGEYNNCTSNFVVTVSNITPESGYYCTGVTATGGHNTVTGPDGSGNYTVSYNKGNNITSTITANFAPNPKYTVTWSMDGDVSSTASYEEGESIVFPGTATGCDGMRFMGWVSTPILTPQDEAPEYVTSATMPAHTVTYYAVFAEENEGGSGSGPAAGTTLWAEDFSGYDADDVPEGNTPNSHTGTTVYNNGSVTYACTNGGTDTKVYSSGSPGSGNNILISKGNGTFEVSGIPTGGATELTVTYAKSGSGSLNITVSSNASISGSTITVNSGTTIDIVFKNTTGGSNLRFDDAVVSVKNGGSATTYSGYTTSCGAGISAKNIGWITTTKGQKVKRVINVSAKNFDEATTLAATCANSHFEVTLGATAVPEGASGLSTTLTVEYTPADFGVREENVEIELTAGDKSKTITVSGRSLPEEFVIITKKNSTWYALPANMTGGPNEYAGVEVNPNNTTTPTVVPVSPSNAIYSLASVADSRYADNGHCVRLVGNDNLCLWSNMATNTTKTNIQNKTSVTTAATDNHDWLLSTTDGVHYTIANPHHPQYGEGRRLAYGTKFGMYAEETEFFIVSAGCSSQPGEVAVSPRRVEATFSWVSNASSMTIDLYTNELMTEGHKTATASSSPYIFIGLEESTPYWYKLTPGTDSDCAVTGSFTTTGPAIDIVEWQEDGVVLFIDNGEEVTPMIVIDGQEEHGSITGGGGDATELFFAKYFEGSGSMKLVSVFNGTKNDINLSDYSIFVRMRGGSGSWSPSSDVTLDLGTLGSIKAGQEIIFFSRPLDTETELADCSDNFLDDKVDNHSSAESNPRWVECDGETFNRINFNGNDPILLKKSGSTIDIIGSEGDAPTATNCNSEKGWGGTVRNMDKGKSPSHPDFDAFYEASSQSPVSTQDSIDLLSAFGINLTADEIPLTTARCIFFRDKRVLNGDSAVLMNGSTFVTFTNHDTFTSEWYGRSVCMTAAMENAAGASGDAQATCNSYQDIANMDYNEYYIEWHNIDPGTSLEDFTYDPATNEYIIPIDNMHQYACLNLRFQLVQGENVLTEATQQVPIIVKGNVDTNDPLFSELVIDQSTHQPSYTHSIERCKNCDVIVLGSASLTKGDDADAKDVPEVGNVKVYPGGQLIVPSGTTYKMKSLALRRQEDIAASANIVGDITFTTPAPAPARKDAVDKPIRKTPTGEKKTYLDLRVDPTNWHYISLPYDCDVADIRYANPEETDVPVLGTDYLIKWYNGEKRAATQSGGCWEMVASDATLKAGLGYIFSIPGDGKVMREFRFPMDNEVIAQEKADKMVNGVYSYGGDQDISIIRANHRGWNLLGNPYLMPYSSDITDPLMTGYIVPDYPSDPEEIWDGHYKFDPNPSTNLRYIVEPIDNGWSGYTQVTIASYEMKPFTSYFVQIGGDHPEDPQGINFHVASVSHSPVRRAPAEYEEVEDRHPVWCAVTLTNPKGEKDETTLLISDNFTDGYDMMDDLTKWRGTYYQYAQITTAPVLASRNNEGEMAFNALPDSSALAGVPLNYFAASQGFYTIAYDDKYDRDMEVKEVKLWDKTTNQWYNLMYEPYSFSTARTDNKDRFVLSVRVERKQNQTTTDLENVGTYKGDKPRKLLINGLLYIQRGKDVYDVTGKQLLNR